MGNPSGKKSRTDVLTPEQRSFNMSRIKAINTGPELSLRKSLHARGIRYRLHAADLAGRPDLVLRKFKAVIFVNGCFWHGHDCPKGVMPKTNQAFWKAKIEKNRERDSKVVRTLRQSGWRTLFVWECALRGRAKWNQLELTDEVIHWLVDGGVFVEISGRW